MTDVNQIIPIFIGQIERYNAIITADGPANFDDQRALLNSLSRLMAFGEVLPGAEDIAAEENAITPLAPALDAGAVSARFKDFDAYPYVAPFATEEGDRAEPETKNPASDIVEIHRHMNEIMSFFAAHQPAAALKHAAQNYPAWGRHAIDLKSYLHAYFYDH